MFYSHQRLESTAVAKTGEMVFAKQKDLVVFNDPNWELCNIEIDKIFYFNPIIHMFAANNVERNNWGKS